MYCCIESSIERFEQNDLSLENDCWGLKQCKAGLQWNGICSAGLFHWWGIVWAYHMQITTFTVIKSIVSDSCLCCIALCCCHFVCQPLFPPIQSVSACQVLLLISCIKVKIWTVSKSHIRSWQLSLKHKANTFFQFHILIIAYLFWVLQRKISER